MTNTLNGAPMLGLNYLAGPFEWLADSDTTAIIALLGGLDAHYRGERYRVSHWLRQRVWLNPRPGVQPS